jgi:peptidoglycan hydrolase-like protein with peptidoglycan-binding domain
MFVQGIAGSVPQRRVLHVGLIGEDVRERQGLLNALLDSDSPLGQSNLAELEQDGEYGSRTMMRVKEFQSRNNLNADGVIGPETDTQMDAVWLDYYMRGLDRSANKN